MAKAKRNSVLVLSYDKCGTCKKALAWLGKHEVETFVRPIVDDPPTASELKTWITQSKKDIRKWLNTSGQSYRAIGKAKVDAASDAEILRWLAADGKLIKRPVVVAKDRVLVGFKEEEFADLA